MTANCPRCGATDIIRCSVAYQTGTSTGKFSGMGMDLSGDFGGFTGTKTTRTLLAASVAPPPRPSASNNGITVAAFSGLGMVIAWLWGFATFCQDERTPKWIFPTIFVTSLICGIPLIIYGVYLAGKEKKQITEKHAALLEDYFRHWVCLRCGTRFTIN